jgi:alpha-amylase/alpha-mannosidase (GH57 family)
MHQPYYKDPHTGTYAMPWVRLHALKDYFDMVARVEAFPGFRCTVNVAPSLLMQLQDYTGTEVSDYFLYFASKPAADLQDDEKEFLLKNFFSLNWQNMVLPYPRYRSLLQMRQSAIRPGGSWKIEQFLERDYRDLQVWFQLAWSGQFLQQQPLVHQLISKGKDFTEDEKLELLSLQKKFLAQIIPLYRRLHQTGQIELSCSPLYHPILPLLCDTRSARVARPDLPLPSVMLCSPEDARHQIIEGMRRFEQVFGAVSSGMWPSEGSVSPQVASMMIDAGLAWTASDEAVLQLSLQDTSTESHFYPYLFTVHGKSVAVFFRDRTLSDLVGFTYSRWPAEAAARDFVDQLGQMSRRLPQDSVVSVILDGENAWEYYPQNGVHFWENVLALLQSQSSVETVTFSEYLRRHAPRKELKSLHTGSWIHADFKVWIGHPEKNHAWELLAATREVAARLSTPETDPEIWEHIYVTEGSDWFWWYGDDHASDYKDDFDRLFRSHLQSVYQKLKLQPPAELSQPILKGRGTLAIEPPASRLNPRFDGRVSSYFEWLGAGRITAAAIGGAMHAAQPVIREIWFGFNEEYFFLRLDVEGALIEKTTGKLKFEISFQQPEFCVFEIEGEGKNFAAWVSQHGERRPLLTFAFHKVMEIGMPMSVLSVVPGSKVRWFLQVWREDRQLERWPRDDSFEMRLALDEERSTWFV